MKNKFDTNVPEHIRALDGAFESTLSNRSVRKTSGLEEQPATSDGMKSGEPAPRGY